MARFNADFWEIPTNTGFLENIPAERGLWFESEEDRQRGYALKEFRRSAMPLVRDLIKTKLTARQREVLDMYYFCGMTQEAIAASLRVRQSTVSRHLFGTTRHGKKVGGAIPKLQKWANRPNNGPLRAALARLRARLGYVR